MQDNPPPYVRRTHRRSLAFLALVFLPGATSAHAAVLLSCRPSDTELVCRLRSVLALLTTAAGILAVLLIVAILAAVRAYRRKPRKLTPDDITPDAK